MNSPPQRRAARFRSAAELFHADACEPLALAARRHEVQLAALGRGPYPGRRLPPGDLREVRSVGFWDARKNQNWGLDWHRNEGIEFTFLAGGQLPFAVEDQAVALQAGDMTVTRPWQEHRVGGPQVPASRLIWLILDVGVRRPNQPWRWPNWLLLPPAKLQRLTHQLRHNEQISWRANRELAGCFEAIGEAAAARPDANHLTRLKIAINALLVALADQLDQRRPRLNLNLSSAERTVRLFLDELAVRVEEPWTLETMAGQCGLGRTHFSLYCRKLTNHSPMSYLTICRVDKACRILSQRSEDRIINVALDCGFQSSQYFATVFKRLKGCSPIAWRSSHSKSVSPRNSMNEAI